MVHSNAKSGVTIQWICEVKDNGELVLTKFQRVVITIKYFKINIKK